MRPDRDGYRNPRKNWFTVIKVAASEFNDIAGALPGDIRILSGLHGPNLQKYPPYVVKLSFRNSAVLPKALQWFNKKIARPMTTSLRMLVQPVRERVNLVTGNLAIFEN